VLSGGRAVFLEKPVAVDLATAREMAAAVQDAGVVDMVGLVLRSSPALLALRELIRDPAAGRLMNVSFRDDQYIPIQGMYASDWRGDRTRAGSGVLLEHSIHDLDMLEWLGGPIETIAAQSASFHGLDGIEDSVSLLARYEAGHSATLISVWHDILSRPSLRRIEAFSERSLATLEGDLVGPVRWQRQGTAPDDTDEGSIDDATIEPWLAQRGIEVVPAEEHFLRAVERGGPSPGPTLQDALRAHELVDAAYRSAASGGAPQTVRR
jgi:predicted dehydrogenase